MRAFPKPPLGLRPRWISDEQRLNEIVCAMIRYSKDNNAIPHSWIDELEDIVKKIPLWTQWKQDSE